jgi:hypothetical protein
MSPLFTVLISALAATVGLSLFQRLTTNREGSEQVVALSLARRADGEWAFVAMQYYYGILKRTYLVFVTDRHIAGAKVKGGIASPRALDAKWKDPLFYVSPKLAEEYGGMDVASMEFLARCRANFRIDRSEIREVEFTDEPKWGMGAVPYSGRIFLRTRDGKSLELILLGDQDGPEICRRLQGLTASRQG